MRDRRPLPHQPTEERLTESESAEFEERTGRVRGLVIALTDVLTTKESAEVEHFIAHDELGQALYTLAWILASKQPAVPREALLQLRALAEDTYVYPDLPRLSWRLTADRSAATAGG